MYISSAQIISLIFFSRKQHYFILVVYDAQINLNFGVVEFYIASSSVLLHLHTCWMLDLVFIVSPAIAKNKDRRKNHKQNELEYFVLACLDPHISTLQVAGIRVGSLLEVLISLVAALAVAFAYSWMTALVILGFMPMVVLASIFHYSIASNNQARSLEARSESTQVRLSLVSYVTLLHQPPHTPPHLQLAGCIKVFFFLHIYNYRICIV